MTAPFSPVTASAAALAVKGSRWIWEPLAIRLGTATSANCANSSDALNLAYTYASSDNGNVLSQAINRHGVYNTQSYSFSATQSYNSVTAYDGVNRLKSFSEPPTSGVVTENYGYDAFGNRWVTSPAPPTPEIPTTQSAYSKTNRITGWGYDGSGNVTSITGMQRTFTYDAENRQVTATINGGAANTYAYDGDGRRVQKVSSAGTTTYIYDAQGQLAAEYGTGANPVSGTQYLTADHLGSTRLITDGSANTAECLDYYPFGREIPTGANGRPACYSSGTYPANPDIASEKFTGKERDAETGLDNFLVRYMSSAEGRFTSPDPLGNFVSDPANPQSWNLYNYVLNDPLALVDPSGTDIIPITVSGDNCFYEVKTEGEGKGAHTVENALGCAAKPQPTASAASQNTPPSAKSNGLKQKICNAIPSGRTIGASGGVGLLGGVVGGGELVLNYDTGQVSAFSFGGFQLGWNGGLSGSIYTGYVWGLNGTNSNYSGGFTGVNGGAGLGGFAASSSGGFASLADKGASSLVPNGDVKAAGVGIGAGLLSGFSGGVNATTYSDPLQLGKFWGFGLNESDWTLYAARQVCK